MSGSRREPEMARVESVTHDPGGEQAARLQIVGRFGRD